MTVLSFALALMVSQTEAPSSAQAAAERAAAAAERAAVATERAAEAVEKLAQTLAAAPVAPTAPPPEEKKDGWKGLVGLGLVALGGNAESLMATAHAQLDKKLGAWAIGARASGAYGQTRPTAGGDAEVSALRAGLSLRTDRNLSRFATLFAAAGAETDHVKSVELRAFGELGTGIKFYELKEEQLERVYLRGEVAFRYSQETRFQYFATAGAPARTALPGATLVAPRLGLVFRFALTKDLRVSEEAEVLPNLVGQARFLFNSTTRLSTRLTEALSLSASFLLAFDSAPAAEKKTTDTALTLGLDAAF